LFIIVYYFFKYLILAIFTSGILQSAVMIIPYLQNVFKVVPLNISQWLVILLFPLLQFFMWKF
jgi:magnesium-transporting ATPase (P-type)